MTYPYGLRQLGTPDALREFHPGEARVDAVDLTLGLGSIAGSEDEVRRFVAAVPRYLTLATGEEVALFNRPHQPQNRSKHEWSVVKRPGRGATRPLFAGRLGLVRSVGSEAVAPGPNTWNIYCRLQINPTRWMRHQPLHSPTAHTDYRSETVRLFESEIEASSDGEDVLDEVADNVVIGTEQRLAMAHPQYRDMHYTRYLTAIRDLLLVHVLSRASLQSGIARQGPVSITINHVEVYWEFADLAAVSILHAMESRARNLAARSRMSFRGTRRREASLLQLTEDMAFGRQNNSPCYTFYMRRGVNVKIYAKTNRRVRFEVRFECRQSRNLTGPIVFDSPGHAVSFFNHAAAQAVPVLGDVVDYLFTSPDAGGSDVGNTFDATSQRKEPHELILDVLNAIPDRDIAANIVSSLAINGFVANPGNSRFRNAIRRLKALHILKPAHRFGRKYLHFVHDRYAIGLDILREARMDLHYRNHVSHGMPRRMRLNVGGAENVTARM